MLNIFDSILYLTQQKTIEPQKFLACIGVALVCGLLFTLAYRLFNRVSNSFATALVFLPPVICVVIMMVNESVGIGVAIAGAFSLIRFRSATGTAKEIAVIFMAMCAGLINGVGYLAYALIFTLCMCLLIVVANFVTKAADTSSKEKTLRVTLPEDLNYETVFDDIFAEFTEKANLVRVKTSNMGSLFKVSYEITMKKGMSEKDLIDRIRIKNGNLEVSIVKGATENDL